MGKGKQFKPRRRRTNDPPVYIVVFRSRNKDNESIPGYRERSASFLTRHPEDLMDEFDSFIKKGLPHETSRFYVSVNPRNEGQIRRTMLHTLIDADDIDVTSMDQLAVQSAGRFDARGDRKVVFDIDHDQPGDSLLYNQETRIVERIKNGIITLLEKDGVSKEFDYRTPHGFHVVSSRGIDPRGVAQVMEEELGAPPVMSKLTSRDGRSDVQINGVGHHEDGSPFNIGVTTKHDAYRIHAIGTLTPSHDSVVVDLD